MLLQTERPYEIGERVEVEIDFLTKPETKTVVTGVGYVVREQAASPTRRHSLRSRVHAETRHQLTCRADGRAAPP